MAEELVRVKRKRRLRAKHRAPRTWLPTWRLTVYAAVAVAALLIAVLTIIYAPSSFAHWRQERFLNRADEALQHDDFNGAITAAEDALKIEPNSLRAFYILAEATEKQSRPETVSWRAQIARMLPLDVDSQLNLASAALRFGQLDTARKALDHVAPAERDRPAYHVVAGWLARAEGDETNVETHFAAARDKEPANDLYQFNLACVRIKSEVPEKNAEARETLTRLTQIAPFRAGALRALLNDAIDRNDLTAADDLAQDLQMSPQVTFSDYLLCLSFYRKLDPKKFSALLDKVKPVAAKNPADLGLLMGWMNSNGLAAEVLKWSDKLGTDATSKPAPAVALAEAYAITKNWSRLKRWTRGGSWGESDFLRLAYQAHAVRQMRVSAGDAEFEAVWRSAERAALDQPDREMNLARLASKWGFNIEAEQLWLRLSKHPLVRREALDALADIYRANNDIANLHKTLQRLHEAAPQDPVAAANYARLALLLDQNTSDAHRVAKAAYDQAPDNLAVILSYALSLYAQGRSADGLKVLRKLPPEQSHEPHAAAYVAVLWLDENQPEVAREFIDAAHNAPIFPEEKKLLDEAVAKAGAQTSPPPPAAPSPTPTETPSAR